jgi:hypothetical protein
MSHTVHTSTRAHTHKLSSHSMTPWQQTRAKFPPSQDMFVCACVYICVPWEVTFLTSVLWIAIVTVNVAHGLSGSSIFWYIFRPCGLKAGMYRSSECVYVRACSCGCVFVGVVIRVGPSRSDGSSLLKCDWGFTDRPIRLLALKHVLLLALSPPFLFSLLNLIHSPCTLLNTLSFFSVSP